MDFQYYSPLNAASLVGLQRVFSKEFTKYCSYPSKGTQILGVELPILQCSIVQRI